MLPEVIPCRELDGSSSLAAWNLRPTLGFSGITWTSKNIRCVPGKPSSPWITCPLDLHFPTHNNHYDTSCFLSPPWEIWENL